MSKLKVVALANGKLFRHKVGAAVIAQMRGGATSIRASLHYMMLMFEMIIPGSTYWNIRACNLLNKIKSKCTGTCKKSWRIFRQKVHC